MRNQCFAPHRRTFKRQRGMQLVEMAFVFPILMALLGGITELSWYYYTSATLARATRAGAGYIAAKSFTSTEINKAKYLTLCGETSDCNSPKRPMVMNLALSNINVALNGTYPNQTVTVSIINYSYTPLFNLVNLAKVSSWNSSVTQVPASTTMRYTGSI